MVHDQARVNVYANSVSPVSCATNVVWVFMKMKGTIHLLNAMVVGFKKKNIINYFN